MKNREAMSKTFCETNDTDLTTGNKQFGIPANFKEEESAYMRKMKVIYGDSAHLSGKK